MRAITADIYSHECSPIAEADTFTDLPDNLLLITEDQWGDEPQPGQLWQGNIPATFYPPVADVLANRKEARRAEIYAKRDEIFGAGFTVPSGPMQGAVLQVRDNEDRTNWLTSQASYSTAVAMGHGDVVNASFRCADNTTHIVSYREGLQTLLAMAAWGAAVMARSWELKDAIAAAADLAELDAIDIGTGWPS